MCLRLNTEGAPAERFLRGPPGLSSPGLSKSLNSNPTCPRGLLPKPHHSGSASSRMIQHRSGGRPYGGCDSLAPLLPK